jgi:hypothetical protein
VYCKITKKIKVYHVGYSLAMKSLFKDDNRNMARNGQGVVDMDVELLHQRCERGACGLAQGLTHNL